MRLRICILLLKEEQDLWKVGVYRSSQCIYDARLVSGTTHMSEPVLDAFIMKYTKGFRETLHELYEDKRQSGEDHNYKQLTYLGQHKSGIEKESSSSQKYYLHKCVTKSKLSPSGMFSSCPFPVFIRSLHGVSLVLWLFTSSLWTLHHLWLADISPAQWKSLIHHRETLLLVSF